MKQRTMLRRLGDGSVPGVVDSWITRRETFVMMAVGISIFLASGVAYASYALRFDDAQNEYVETRVSGLLDGGAEATLELWVYVDTAWWDGGSWRNLAGMTSGTGSTSGDDFLFGFHRQSGANVIGLRVNGATPDDTHDGDLPHDNEWAHLAGVFDNGTADVYINGEHVASGNEDDVFDEVNNLLYLSSTSSAYGVGARGFVGMMADVRLWDTARSQSEIQQHMNSRLTGNEVGLLTYLPLDEGSGDTVYDLSPTENHGAIVGAQWVEVDDLPIAIGDDIVDDPDIPAVRGAGLSFDGSETWVDLPHDIIPDWDQVWGFEAWVRPSSVDDRHTIINLRGGDAGSSIDFYCYIQNGVLGWYNGGHSDSFGSFKVGQWSHVAVLFDGSDFQVFQDGAYLGSHSTSEGFSSHPAVGSTMGGNQRDPLTYQFGGLLSDVRLWRGEIPTEHQILFRLIEGVTGDEEGLLGYWPLDEGEGYTAHDLSGNENHGTIHNGEWVSETVPEVTGLHWTEAATVLEDAGFQVTFHYIDTGQISGGGVHSQNPVGEAQNLPGWWVHIVVESERQSFAPAAPVWLMLLVMAGVLAAASSRMRSRVFAN